MTGVGDVWQAPLKVRDNAQDLNFAVTLDCTKGEITYRLNR
ncbi:MAG: YebF family protein [Sodalis sp. (in: enterobacteria)]